MEKLELRHIVGYLAYGLNGEYKEWLDDAKTDLGAFSIVEITGVDFQNNKILIRNGYVTERDSIKPILRPLSDLTKEIEVDGEKFVPIEELFTLAFGSHSEVNIKDFMGIVSCENCIEKLTLNIEYMCFKTDAMAPDGESDWNPTFNQLQLFEKLYEWHFDIHDLIGKGLAIDINTLTK